MRQKWIEQLILFKVLILQKLFSLSYEELECQVNNKRCFVRIIGFGVMNNILDATTIAFFRERLRKAGVIEDLFEKFVTYLPSQGRQARGDQIINATLIPVPKQRYTHEKKAEIEAERLQNG